MPDPDEHFAALWDAHYDDVLAYAARRVDRETARDVAAETFLIAWRRRGDLPADRPFPWLLHVARNVLANEARGSRRRGRLWGRLRDDRDLQRPVADVATALAEHGRIGAALRRLPERDREVLQLVGWEELDAKDADAAQHRRFAPPRPDQWAFLETRYRRISKPGDGEVRTPRSRARTEIDRSWTRADGKKVAWFENGRLVISNTGGGTPPTDYASLAALSRDPDALLSYVHGLRAPGDREAGAFQLLGSILGNSVPAAGAGGRDVPAWRRSPAWA